MMMCMNEDGKDEEDVLLVSGCGDERRRMLLMMKLRSIR